MVWFTGYSGSGKTTIATALDAYFEEMGFISSIVDGDVLRTGLCSDLGFSDEDRTENVRRAGFAAAMMANAGLITICALISPFARERDAVRAKCKADGVPFIEVYLSTSFSECERRDVKGLYAKARSGEIPKFTGLTSTYEPPVSPEITIDTSVTPVEESVATIFEATIKSMSAEVVA